MRTEAGFTLIELLVVMAILALMTAATAPMLFREPAGFRLSRAAREVALALREARAEAIRRNRDQVVTIDVGRRLYGLGEAPGRSLPASLSISLYTARSQLVDGSVGHIRFHPDGGSTGGRVRLAQGEVRRDVLVDWLTGSVRIAE
ncbi:MAG TPA: GspH/FimT family pseudopilin [Azospirillaceae bacterium]|nr:GspH/FimT family pseudopilin [Azospirillaceae bacterium]